ncbi:MAG: DUF1254 domain-containing protein [Candidatus Melainabacteria bacterium]|nr:DUF1254 domain-containing protein [Candidatus Melainabacteria bacterium]
MILTTLAGALKKTETEKLGFEEIKQIAAEAYIYAYPLVLMELTRLQGTNIEANAKPASGPMNEFHHFRTFPDANFKEVIRPNFDTLYSIAWLDVSKEPLVVSVPDTAGRYYLLPMYDMWTDCFAVPGKRTSGTGDGQFVVASPGWTGKLPEGAVRIDAPTPYIWVIGRTQTNGPKDYQNVHKVQDGFTVTPLSQLGKKYAAPPTMIDTTVDMKTPPMIQVARMSAKDFFEQAARLMKKHPPHMADGSILLRIRRIGLVPGEDFNFDKLDAESKKAFEEGIAFAVQTIKDLAPSIARVVNGWQMNLETMGAYGISYFKRAVVALLGLGANQVLDAVYPLNLTDADGEPLNADKKYTIHFAKESMPPVDAFWSVTLYDGDGFPVPNSINRFAIGDRDDLKYNQDGSLDLYVESESPGKDLESNWLPSGKSGPITLTMRLYAPRVDVLSGKWSPPPVKKRK